MNFIDFSLPHFLNSRLGELKFETPTQIQALAIPVILTGESAIIRAETGSGKTASYVLPLLSLIKEPNSRIRFLIIVPTRELAVQVQKEIKSLAYYLPNLKVSAFYGGHGFDAERKSLVQPPEVLVATPGRLADHLRRDTLKIEHVSFFVLDEADKLLEMGFEDELKFILKYLPFKRQTIMLSATFPPSLEKLSETIFRKVPLRLEVDLNAVPNHIENFVIRTIEQEKIAILTSLVEKHHAGSVIIFCNTREKCRELFSILKIAEPGIIHGELEQIDRDKIMAMFRNGSKRILVATDIASRGIDIAKIGAVINFELPDKLNAFLHRAGRTGRAGAGGRVYSLVNDSEWRRMQAWLDMPPYQLLENKTAKGSPDPKTLENKYDKKTTLHILAGRKEKIGKGDIMGALIAEAGLKPTEIGLIEIFDHFSFVAVPQALASKTIEKLNSGKIKGRKRKVSLVK